jgi:hypothetical protein
MKLEVAFGGGASTSSHSVVCMRAPTAYTLAQAAEKRDLQIVLRNSLLILTWRDGRPGGSRLRRTRTRAPRVCHFGGHPRD